MTIGARVWGLLLLLPVVGQLVVLVVVGVAAPRYVTRLPLATLGVLTAIVGAASALSLLVASARCRGRLRASWGALALACALWSAALFGAVRGWPTSVVWGLLRGLAFAAVALAILLSPGVCRTAREWRLLLLDGWLVGISAFLIGYVALRLTTSNPYGKSVSPAVLWIPFDLVIASTVSGLAVHATGARAPRILLVLAALLTVTSDTTWTLTVHPEPGAVPPFGVIEWLIALTALGFSTLTRQLDPWSSARPDPHPHPAGPRLTRLAQIAMVPGLLTAAMPGADRTTFVAAACLVAGLTMEVALTRRQHRDLRLALQGQAEQLEQLLQESRDAIVRLDPAGRIEFANEAVSDVFGHPAGSLVGTSWFDLVLPEDQQAIAGQLARLDDGDIVSCRIAGRFRHGDAGWRELESTASRRGEGGAGFTLSVRDVSERSQLEADLRRQASTDWLTGLLNRKAFITLLEERLPRGDTHLLFLDLDGFKAVNDTEGHVAGDRLLRKVADVLRAEQRPGDVAARFGGDEFAVLLGVHDPEGTRALAARLVERIGRLSSRYGSPIAASVGVADGHHDSAESLIRRADRAMYQAKAGGGSRFVIFADRRRSSTGCDGRLPTDLAHGTAATPALIDLGRLADGRGRLTEGLRSHRPA
jgi:diguanylate cyclase (GGDEF)-like protein/PAS domain S-box-containing protein